MATRTPKRFTRRTSVLALAAVAGSTLLAACGEVEVRYVQGPPGPAGPSGPRGEKGAAGPRGARGAAGAAGKAVIVEKKVEVRAPAKPQPAAPTLARCTGALEFWVPWPVDHPTHQGLAGPIGKQFTASRPGCSLKVIRIGNNRQLLEKLVVTVVADTPATNVAVPTQATGRWAHNGVLEPLDQYMQVAKLTKDQFWDGYWLSMHIRGKTWRLPFQLDINFPLYWNKAHFREAGFDPEKGPKTIDELEEYILKLTKRDSAGNVIRAGMTPWDTYGIGNNSMQTWGYAWGGEFYNPETDKITANDPKIVAALEWMVSWAKRLDQPETQKLIKGSAAADELGRGVISMAPLITTSIPQVKREDPNIEIGGDLLPAHPPTPAGSAWFSGRGMGIIKNTKDPEGAWDLCRWLGATPEGTLAVAQHASGLPGWKPTPAYPVFDKLPEFRPAMDSLRITKNVPPGAMLPSAFTLKKIRDAIAGKTTAKAALDAVTREEQVKLDKARAQERG